MFGTVPPYPSAVTAPLAPLLTWVHVLVGCAIALGVEGLLMLVVSWRRHWFWLTRLSAIVPLMAGVGAGLAAHYLYDRYLYWAQTFYYVYSGGTFPAPGPLVFISYRARIANQEATPLGWVLVAVTALLLLLGLIGLLRLVMVQKQQGAAPTASVAAQS